MKYLFKMVESLLLLFLPALLGLDVCVTKASEQSKGSSQHLSMNYLMNMIKTVQWSQTLEFASYNPKYAALIIWS